MSGTPSLGERLEEIRGKFKGRPGVIAASGPSLDPDRLRSFAEKINAPVIPINHAMKAFQDSEYGTMFEVGYSGQLDNLVDWVFTGWGVPVGGRKGVFALHKDGLWQRIPRLPTETIGVRTENKRDYEHYGFNWELCNGNIYLAHTSVHAALQIAVWLGHRKIYIAGMDLCNAEDRTHFFGNKKEDLSSKERESWFNSCFEMMENITRQLHEKGIDIINLSPISRLKTIMPTEKI